MPLPGVHLRVARDILDTWSSRRIAPFDTYDRRNRGAFMHGALGPDMGFFPGGCTRISELAHIEGSGDLTRAILGNTRDDAEVAFAFGWCTHVLLDAHLHPLINQRAARLSGRSVHTPPNQLLHMHQRLEMGLDLALQRNEPFSVTGLAPFIRDSEFLVRAFESVYGYSPAHSDVIASHRAVARWTGPLLALQSVLVASVGDDPARPEWIGTQRMALAGVRGLRILTGIVSRPEASATAFLRPIEPDPAFGAQIQSAIARFHEEFESHAVTGLQTLPNYNLDDGSIAEVSPENAVVA